MNLSIKKKVVEFKRSCLKQGKASSIQRNVINLFILYELDKWSADLSTTLTIGDCGFKAVKLTKNNEP